MNSTTDSPRPERGTWPPQVEPSSGYDHERLMWDLEAIVKALSKPEAAQAVEVALDGLDAAQQRRACDWQDGAWKAAGRWLVEHGYAQVWQALYAELERTHGELEYRVEELRGTPEQPFAFLYGERWEEHVAGQHAPLPEAVVMIPVEGTIADIGRRGPRP